MNVKKEKKNVKSDCAGAGLHTTSSPSATLKVCMATRHAPPYNQICMLLKGPCSAANTRRVTVTSVGTFSSRDFISFFWFTFIPAPPVTDCSRARGQRWWVTHALCISVSTPLWSCKPGPSFVLRRVREMGTHWPSSPGGFRV